MIKPQNCLYAASEVRELDRIAIEERGISGLTLMRRAASATVSALLARWPAVASVGVFCGSGNNAGDGYILAGMLAERGVAVQVVKVGDPEKLGPDAASGLAYCLGTSAGWAEPGDAARCDVLVDALLGTGISGGVRPAYVAAIDCINDATRPVVAVDIPSGLSADSGQILGACVTADMTVTFIGVKRGLLTGQGPDVTGELVHADLGVPDDVFAEVGLVAERLDFDDCLAQLPARMPSAFKNTFGHVLIVGGASGMGGAVILAGEAALRSGAGLVSIATDPTNVSAILGRRPELMAKGVTSDETLDALLERASCVVVGPGLGTDDWGRWLFERVMAADKPGVLDADGLNLLSQSPRRLDGFVLTPHPGEAARLLGGRDRVEDRFSAVAEMHRRFGATVLLKGAGTLVQGEGPTGVCPYGNPGMATAGMGDVLSGVIGALLSQGMDPDPAARLGAVLHARAGDAAALGGGARGMIATDLMPHLRRLLS